MHDQAVAAPRKRPREVRLGLVMYGGVSLAVYISGVAREFFRLVQGNGVYKLLKALLDADVTVDIISGTSAGGINGIFLAYALAGSQPRNFADTAPLWRMLGDINDLLEPPDVTPNDDRRSLLRSQTYYETQLREAFRAMTSYQDPDDDPSETRELDLFVTGTDLRGRRYTVFDDLGTPLDLRDHRVTFQVKHRRGRLEPFADASTDEWSSPTACHAALGRLARVTSCFPVAFEPVEIALRDGTPNDPGQPLIEAEKALGRWGRLSRTTWLVDGGVMDNAPFSQTVREIYRRTANREVKRMLFYVEPDPERFDGNASIARPGFYEAAMAGMVGIKMHESIEDDLEQIARRNSKVEQLERLTRDVESDGPTTWPPSVAPDGDVAEPLRSVYSNARLGAIRDRIVAGILKTNGVTHLLQGEQRRQASELVRAFNDDWQGSGPDTLRRFDIYFRLRRAFHVTYAIYAHLHAPAQGEAPAPPAPGSAAYVALTQLWEAFNRQLRFLEIVLARMEHLVDFAPIDWQDRAPVQVWQTVECLFASLLDPRDLRIPSWDATSTPPDGRLTRDELDSVNRQLRDRCEALVKSCDKGDVPEDLPGELLLERSDRYEANLFASYVSHADDVRVARDAYAGFLVIDSCRHPLEVASDIHERDVIRTVRISPHDAQLGFSQRKLEEKVAGDALGHFAGFLKRSWRSNDILWGRLDGICRLVSTLLRPETLRHGLADPDARQALRALAAPAALRRMFPNAGEDSRAELGGWLLDLAAGTEDAFRDKTVRDRRQLLIELAQLEVLHEDLPTVVADAVDEQHGWNQFRYDRNPILSDEKLAARLGPRQVGDAQQLIDRCHDLALCTARDRVRMDRAIRRWLADDPVALHAWETGGGDMLEEAIRTTLGCYTADGDGSGVVFRTGSAPVDDLIAATAAEEYSRTALGRIAGSGSGNRPPLQTNIGLFFRNRYAVGKEHMKGSIPPLVILELLTRTLLVLRACVVGGLPEKARAAVQSHAVYRFGMDLPLRAMYRIVRFLRRNSGARLGVAICMGTVAVVLLAIGIVWFRSLIWIPNACGSELDPRGIIALVLLPIALLVTLGAWIHAAGRRPAPRLG
jgi:predicted acylesterase/phospholipase RssA